MKTKYNKKIFLNINNIKILKKVKSVTWDSTSKLLASCSRDKTIWIWDYE